MLRKWMWSCNGSFLRVLLGVLLCVLAIFFSCTNNPTSSGSKAVAVFRLSLGDAATLGGIDSVRFTISSSEMSYQVSHTSAYGDRKAAFESVPNVSSMLVKI
jgi:hypothetical protein